MCRSEKREGVISGIYPDPLFARSRLKDRACTVIQVTQPTRRPDAEFYQAQVFIDDELNVPIRYIAYDWPGRSGEVGEVIEEYNYLNLDVNVGLTDSDFNPRNEAYNFYS